jgi:hypothetical protein
MRKRHEAVMKAKEALRYKQIFKSPTGGKQSTVDEEKAVAVALRRFAEAEAKMANVKKWIRQLHKEAHIYRGSVQRLGTTVSTDLPHAASKIARMVTALEGYVALTATSVSPDAQPSETASVSRGTAVPEVGGAIQYLRQRTPLGPAKDAASNGDPAAAWTAGEFAPGDPSLLARLQLERQPLDPASSVILAVGVQTAKRIYLERSAPAFPGDSGWYIGTAEGPIITAHQSLRMDDLLTARPQFSELFSLPTGTMIVIDAAGICAVLDAKDEEHWIPQQPV